MVFIKLIFLRLIVLCKAQIAYTGMPGKMTHGRIFKNRINEFYTAKPFETYSNTSTGRCNNMFSADSRIISMNVVDQTNTSVECQLFNKKFDNNAEEGVLTQRDGSTYYEKSENKNYLKASKSVVSVETKDEKPGIARFEQPNGYYRIKLNHISGSVSCDPSFSFSHFGCERGSTFFPNRIIMVVDFRGDIIVSRFGFDEYDTGDSKKTSFVATSQCVHLNQGSTYAFWYNNDYKNSGEDIASGKTSFEFLVEPCY